MSNATLMVDSGGRFATIDELNAVPVAPGSHSYNPVAHGIVRETLLTSIDRRGLSVIDERWALSGEKTKRCQADQTDPTIYTGPGARAFGLIRLGNGATDDVASCIAVRNSQDKSIAIGLACGINVFICDNLCLSGAAVMYRRHTRFMDIREESEKALDAVMNHITPFRAWMEGLRTVNVDNAAFDQIVCDGIRQGIMPHSSARDMLNAWHDGEAPGARDDFGDRLSDGVYAPRTAWTAHGLWTDVVGNRQNLTASGSKVIDDQKILNGIFSNRLHLPPANRYISTN